MPHDEVVELKIMIAQLAGDVNNLAKLVQEIRDTAKNDNDKHNNNSERITRIEEKVKTAQEDINKNFEQHRDFYKTQDYIEQLKGSLRTWQFIAGFGGLAGLAALVKGLMT